MVILATVAGWFAVTIVSAYQWVASALADPGIASYENNVVFPFSAFVVFRGVYLFAAGVLVVLVELILFETLAKQDREAKPFS
jgi:hypothetical protein